MGTNYYLHQTPDGECCECLSESLHIGKSSAGWCFALHVMPENNISTLDDWRNLWAAPEAFIRDEYGKKIFIADMELIITARLWHGKFPRRRSIDGSHCIGHGNGTWDYVIGDFS